MPVKKSPKAKIKEQFDSIPQHASDWFRQFVKHLELHFIDVAQGRPCDADDAAYQLATLRAVFQTLLDSGMDMESLVEAAGQVAVEQDSGHAQWTDELNQRRFALIDREIQGTLTPAEQIELAGLTKIMRQHVESEVNLPMEGARALHRKLMDLETRDKPH